MQAQGIKSVKKLGIQDSLDFEVDHPDHNFYAEGVVSSNSHAAGYFSLTATCVFLKANYPLEFFCCALNNVKHEADPVNEVSKIAGELPFFSIKLLPPHILKSDIETKIEGNNLRMGLGAIKGVSDAAISKIEKFKNKYSNKFEIFSGANAAKIPLNIFYSIIMSGGMDDFFTTSRDRIYLEYFIWNKLKDKEKKYALSLGSKYKFDLFGIIKDLNEKIKDEKGKPIIKGSRRLTIRKHITPQYELFKKNSRNLDLSKYWAEKTLLGFAYSVNLYDIYGKETELTTIGEVLGALDGEKFRIIGTINGKVIKAKSRANKTPYLKFMLNDDFNSINCMAFDNSRKNNIEEIKENNGRLPQENDVCVIFGTKKGDSLFIDRLGIQENKIYSKVSELTKKSKNVE